MLRTVDARGGRARDVSIPRAQSGDSAVADVVAPILQDVARRGSVAALEVGERLDGVRPASVVVPPDSIRAALATLDPRVRRGLETAIARVRQVHEAQRPSVVSTEVVAGGVVTERHLPVRRVGLYVPGGRAVYPSSVVMNVVPAQVAGVAELVVASPPQRDHDGRPHPTVLAACALLDVENVWTVGGAQAIALFAYGCATAGLEPVDLVTGPGNAYVTAAKHLLRDVIAIDAQAGPTEIAVLADDAADATLVAADLISQAEHGAESAAVLVTTSASLADRVDSILHALVPATKHAARVEAALRGEQSAAVLVDSIEDGIAVIDAYGPEHLEILTRRASEVAAQIGCAGAIFVGPWSPVSLGDYLAGSNHVLPTGGSARRSSGLSVSTFMRRVQVIGYDESALAGSLDALDALATAEDLPAHATAVRARFSPVGPQ